MKKNLYSAQLEGTAVKGAAGLTFGTGSAAATIGGATEGAFAGLALSVVVYKLITDGWNLGSFYLTMLSGAAFGGIMGALGGAIRYDYSAEYRDLVIGMVEEHGSKLGRFNDVINFDLNEAGVQRAIDYISNFRGYNDINIDYFDKETLMKRKRFPKMKRSKVRSGTRGVFWDGDDASKTIEIFDEALAVDGVNDPTSLLSTVDHEYNHLKKNSDCIAKARKASLRRKVCK